MVYLPAFIKINQPLILEKIETLYKYEIQSPLQPKQYTNPMDPIRYMFM